MAFMECKVSSGGTTAPTKIVSTKSVTFTPSSGVGASVNITVSDVDLTGLVVNESLFVVCENAANIQANVGANITPSITDAHTIKITVSNANAIRTAKFSVYAFL